jgi:hypothetical protein
LRHTSASAVAGQGSPVIGNELIAEGLTMVVHEKCYRGRGGRKARYRPKTGGDGAVSNNPEEMLVGVPARAIQRGSRK